MSTYYASLFADAGILLLGGLSVYIILSTGQLSLGNAAFMGIGAYCSSYLTVVVALPVTVAIAISALAAGMIGAVIAFPALRLRGIYLAMATLGFGEMIRSFLLNFDPMGGAGGFHGMQHVSVGYIWTWSALILVAVMVMERSRMWLEIQAVHDDEIAAGLIGLNTVMIKVGTFAAGAAIAAVSGGLYAHHLVYIEPSNVGFERSIDLVLAVILGGSTTWSWALRRGTAARVPSRGLETDRRLANGGLWSTTRPRPADTPARDP
ncbi:branched-chain amino acid transport system permease protein [Bradyrhizobium sp. GM24.11]